MILMDNDISWYWKNNWTEKFSRPWKKIWKLFWRVQLDKKKLLFINSFFKIWLTLNFFVNFLFNFFQLLSFLTYPVLNLFLFLVFQICFSNGVRESNLMFCEFSCYKVSFIWDLIDLFVGAWILSCLSMEGKSRLSFCYIANLILGITLLLVMSELNSWWKCSFLPEPSTFLGK